MVAKQKQTKNLRFQNENTKEETIYAPRGSHGGLQSGFQKQLSNMKLTTLMTNMNINDWKDLFIKNMSNVKFIALMTNVYNNTKRLICIRAKVITMKSSQLWRQM